MIKKKVKKSQKEKILFKCINNKKIKQKATELNIFLEAVV